MADIYDMHSIVFFMLFYSFVLNMEMAYKIRIRYMDLDKLNDMAYNSSTFIFVIYPFPYS